MLNNYKNYLNFLDRKLGEFFERQKPFIFCKRGCSYCCKKSEFPYSLLEMQYLLSSLPTLSEETLCKIEENLQNIKARKLKYRGKKFRYDCPFLVDDVCSVYEYRGVICRSFGLMTIYDKGPKAPFCSHLGLNYSNVLNLRRRTISPLKYKKLGVKEEPLGFNVSYKFLTGTNFEEAYGIVFGERKPMIDWFLE